MVEGIISIGNQYFRPWDAHIWDADAANFVLLSRRISIYAQKIWRILRQFDYNCNIEMVEEIISIGDQCFRPWDAHIWDADAAYFVLLSRRISIYAQIIVISKWLKE